MICTNGDFFYIKGRVVLDVEASIGVYNVLVDAFTILESVREFAWVWTFSGSYCRWV